MASSACMDLRQNYISTNMSHFDSKSKFATQRAHRHSLNADTMQVASACMPSRAAQIWQLQLMDADEKETLKLSFKAERHQRILFVALAWIYSSSRFSLVGSFISFLLEKQLMRSKGSFLSANMCGFLLTPFCLHAKTFFREQDNDFENPWKLTPRAQAQVWMYSLLVSSPNEQVARYYPSLVCGCANVMRISFAKSGDLKGGKLY